MLDFLLLGSSNYIVVAFFKTMLRLEKDPEKIKTGERQCEISGLGGSGCTNFSKLFIPNPTGD